MNPFQPRPFSQGDLAKVIETTRNTTIEECARVAESYRNVQLEWIKADTPTRIAAAIRALKDKP